VILLAFKARRCSLGLHTAYWRHDRVLCLHGGVLYPFLVRCLIPCIFVDGHSTEIHVLRGNGCLDYSGKPFMRPCPLRLCREPACFRKLWIGSGWVQGVNEFERIFQCCVVKMLAVNSSEGLLCGILCVVHCCCSDAFLSAVQMTQDGGFHCGWVFLNVGFCQFSDRWQEGLLECL
jgi:hypothetical protein